MTERLRILVSGLIAQYPLGGVTWDYLQYVTGLAALGHDVFYVEDTGQWPYDPSSRGIGKNCEYNVRYLAGVMERFGLADRWVYRFPWQSQWFGLSDAKRAEVFASADLLVNVSGTLERPAEYRQVVPRLVYIDSDPVFTQVKLARGQEDFRRLLAAHDIHFSFGERLALGDEAHRVPATPISWLPTRQPVVLDQWATDETPRDVFTTVMNWTSYKPVIHEGRSYGQKDVEMRRFLDLPARVAPSVLELAVAGGKTSGTPYDLLRHKGWRVADPDRACGDLDSYRRYIQTSRAEWSVAKNGYVAGQAGWFSCRSACYLAAGRPVVVQDTGLAGLFPIGEGLLAFATVEEAADGIRRVEADYARHSRAAREIAEAHFDSGRVLGALVEQVFATHG